MTIQVGTCLRSSPSGITWTVTAVQARRNSLTNSWTTTVTIQRDSDGLIETVPLDALNDATEI